MAEQLVNEFTVNRPIDEAWAVITDVERIAPCLPGAQLQEIEGDIYRGVVKIKLGSIAPQFKGQASFIERDDAGHRALLKAEGRDTGGPRQRVGRDRGPRREPLADEHAGDRHDRPAHHRQGRPVRAGDHRRRLQEADGPVRRQPQHDARRAAGPRPTRRARRPAATGSDEAATGAPGRARRGRRRPVTARERARRRHAPPRGRRRAGRRGAAHPQDRQPGQRARGPRRRRRPGHRSSASRRSSSGCCCCCSSCAAGAEGAGPG